MSIHMVAAHCKKGQNCKTDTAKRENGEGKIGMQWFGTGIDPVHKDHPKDHWANDAGFSAPSGNKPKSIWWPCRVQPRGMQLTTTTGLTAKYSKLWDLRIWNGWDTMKLNLFFYSKCFSSVHLKRTNRNIHLGEELSATFQLKLKKKKKKTSLVNYGYLLLRHPRSFKQIGRATLVNLK